MTLPIQYPDSSQIRHQDSTVAEALGLIAGSIKVYADKVELKKVSASSASGVAFAGTSTGGIYEWDALSTLADNGTTVLQPDELPAAGRWIRRIAFS